MFQGFWARAGTYFRGAHWLMCEQNQGGPLSTVPPPEGAERGPIEKFAPLTRANWGSDRQLLDFLLQGLRLPTNTENFVKITRPISEKKISEIWTKFHFFGVRGTSHWRKSHNRCASSPLPAVKI